MLLCVRQMGHRELADTLFGFPVLFGWLGDRIPSRRTLFIFGLVVLAGSTFCFAMGSNVPVLLIARLLEGLSTAIVCTLGWRS